MLTNILNSIVIPFIFYHIVPFWAHKLHFKLKLLNKLLGCAKCLSFWFNLAIFGPIPAITGYIFITILQKLEF